MCAKSATTLDCRYVENLVWFKKSINNDPLDQPSPYFSSTKEILLMFKKVSLIFKIEALMQTASDLMPCFRVMALS